MYQSFFRTTCLLCLVLPAISAAAEETQVAVPLAVGNTWTFRFTQYNSSGDSEQVSKIERKVDRKIKSGGKTWFIVVEPENEVELPSRNDKDGLHEGTFDWEDESKVTEDELYLRFPVEKTPVSYKSYEDTLTVVSTTQKVVVPAGTFTCYVYKNVGAPVEGEGNDPEYIITTYVAPNVGSVKEVTVTKDGKDVFELLSYKLQKK